MRIYTVHRRPYWQAPETEAGDAPVTLVREGFSWFAALLPPVWALWHRQWLAAIALVAAVAVLLNFGATLLGPGGLLASIVGAGLLLWFGCEANDIRRWSMRRAGWHDDGIVCARSRDEAEWRYHDARRRASAIA